MSKHARKILKRVFNQFIWLLPSPKEGNIKAIFLCILIATTFWFFNALNKPDYSTAIDYPVAFDYNHDSTYLLSPLPEYIQVEVSGGGWNLLRKTLRFDRPPVNITLDSPTATKYIEASTIRSLVENRLEDVTLDYIITDTLPLNIDKTSSKKVVLALDTSRVNFAKQYRITSSIHISPPTASLTGPATILAKVPDTLQLTVSDEVIGKNFSEEVQITSDVNEHLQITPEEVQLSFDVAAFSLYKKEVAVTAIDFPDDLSVTLSEEYVKISFWLQNNYVELANNYAFQVVANFKTLNAEDSTVIPVLKSYPDFAKDITITPSKVKVTYAD